MAAMGASPTGLPRRRVLAASTATAAGLLAGPSSLASPRPPNGIESAAVVDPHGEHQAGIVLPRIAQRHCTVAVCALSGPDVAGMLALLGNRIHELTAGGDRALGGLPPAALTVTVGLGPRVVAGIAPTLPGTSELPPFARERIAPADRGGDVLLQVCAMDPLVVSLAVTDLAGRVGPIRWQAHGFRGAPLGETGAARNLLGFTDGIVGPKGDAELRDQVWLDGPMAGGTLAVVRRITLDTAAFLRLPLARQEAVIGRRRDSAEPLSGGGPDAEVDLGAKSADGEYALPADAHVRIAHPLTSGTGLMLRRSYSSADGLVFISFQRELRTFTATQSTMDERDALMRYITVTATGTFLILPGFTPDRPLGYQLQRDAGTQASRGTSGARK
jgi:dye decolorizing peroxidase